MMAVRSLALLASFSPVFCNESARFGFSDSLKYNNEVIEDLLRVSHKDPYAVFDFDGSIIHNDISVAMMHWQAHEFMYRLEPKEFQQKFAPDFNNENCFPKKGDTVIGYDVKGDPVTIYQLMKSMSSDYALIYEKHFVIKKGLEKIKRMDEFKNFIAKVAFFNDNLWSYSKTLSGKTGVMDLMMAQLPRMWNGLTKREVITLAKESFLFHLGQGIRAETLESTGDLRVKGKFFIGLRMYPGTLQILEAFRQRNIMSYIVTAAPTIVINAVLSLPEVNINVEGVHGVDFIIQNNTFSSTVKDGVYTWGSGKAEIIEDRIRKNHKGQNPIYALGDSSGDLAMFNIVRPGGVVHIINTLSSDPAYVEFAQLACKQKSNVMTEKSPVTVLMQGVDHRFGMWIASGYVTHDGVNYKYGANDVACTSYHKDFESRTTKVT